MPWYQLFFMNLRINLCEWVTKLVPMNGRGRRRLHRARDLLVGSAHIPSALTLAPGGAASCTRPWVGRLPSEPTQELGDLFCPKHRNFHQRFVGFQTCFKIKHFPDEDASESVRMPPMVGRIRWSEWMTSLAGQTNTNYKYTRPKTD